MSHADRNLLFGILAVQMDFIGRDALIDAMGAWVLDKQTPLGRILRQRGALADDEHALLEALVAKHLHKHGDDPARSLAATDGLGALRGALEQLADPAVDATLDRVPSAGAATQPDREATLTYPGEPPPAAARFSILRPHARGGLGQVSVALDAELNREVALKELQPERADDPASRTRFLLEAEVTGRLEHPGVVPVYGLGCDARGRPFYAMRLVKGETLKEAIDHFHARQAAAGGGVRPWDLALRQLLSRFVAVCNVVAYAHSRGVIHRDLKPANILLGPYGETLVVDWGLAKVVGRGESARGVAAAEATLQPASGSGSSETLPGTALGTPAYMSPEQAEGRLERTGPASDVYSLGATLYYLLTGQSPIGSTDVGEALRRVQRGEFPPPRAVRPGIPRGLEAICLKALVLKPEGRYPSASDLADEVEHWLADEPVSVYREPLSTRLTRWGRRHRTLASSIGAILLASVLGLSVGNLLLGQANERTERQRRLAVQSAREASQRADDLKRKDYINRVNLAHREVLDDNIARAEDLLEGCPVELRDWEWDYVRRLCHLERLTYRGHFENVRRLAISRDGTWVASGAGIPWSWSFESDRAEVRLWDLETGRQRCVFRDLPGTVQAVAISPDGKLVAAGGGFYFPRVGGWLKVWEATSGKLVQNKPVPGTTVMGLAFHPEGRSLAAAYGLYSDLKHAGYVQLHRVSDLAPIGDRFGELVGGVNAVAFDHDGRRIALAGFERIEVRDVATRVLVKSLTGHTKWVYCVAFHRDGKQLASGGWDNTIKLWDLKTGAAVRTIQGHRGFVEQVAFSPDGTQLAAVDEARGVRLWDPATGREQAAFHGHAHYVHALAFHPDGRRILSGSLDGTVKVWDVVTSRPIVFQGPFPVSSVEFHPDGRHVISKVNKDFTNILETKVWNIDTGREAQAPSPRGRDGPRIHTAAEPAGKSLSRFSPDGTLLAEADQGLGLEVQVRRTSSGKVAYTLRGHTSNTTDIAFSHDGKRIATASHDGTVKLWDARTGQEILTLRGHTHGVNCVAFSPGGSRLASGGIDALVLVWDARSLPEAVFTQAKAHRLVQSRLAEWPRKGELIAQLRDDPGLDPQTRDAALQIAGGLIDRPQPRRLLEASWEVVRSFGREPQDYRRALDWAQEGSRLFPVPDGKTLTVLGAAFYRAGRYQDAQDTFDRAEPLLDLDTGPSSYGQVPRVFRAMILHRLGRGDEARSQLARLRRLFQESPFEFFRSRTLLREAETLIDPQAAGATTGARPAH